MFLSDACKKHSYHKKDVIKNQIEENNCVGKLFCIKHHMKNSKNQNITIIIFGVTLESNHINSWLNLNR